MAPPASPMMLMTDAVTGIPVLAGLSQVASAYDLLLCDVWGVIHNGARAYVPACEALKRFRAGGGTIILVSNAPRPAPSIVPMLDRLGVPRSAYDALVTSGDITRGEVVARAGRSVYRLGPDRDKPIFEGLDVSFAGPAEADYVVCTGFLDDDTETPEDYRGELALMASRKLVMICANPDLVVERGEQLIPCAGAMAALYETLGGAVVYAGKPHRPIYEATLERAAHLRGAPVAANRILAIGDAIRTDVAGAVAMDIPALLVARGIHANEIALLDGGLDAAALNGWAAAQAHRPSAVIERLVW